MRKTLINLKAKKMTDLHISVSTIYGARDSKRYSAQILADNYKGEEIVLASYSTEDCRNAAVKEGRALRRRVWERLQTEYKEIMQHQEMLARQCEQVVNRVEKI